MIDGTAKPSRLNGFSVDVEDGVSIAMRDRFGKHIPQTGRVVTLTRRLLDLLACRDTRATFFVLGQVGEAFPELVREIQAAGHEIGVHGYDHQLYHHLTPEAVREQLCRAKAVLEDLTGERILGHRAPAFSLDENTAWVLDVLLELGFEYDSSIMPCRTVGYGWPGHRLDIGVVDTPGGGRIIEVPLTVARAFGREMPVLGGSYFRLLPFGLSRRIFGSIQRQRPVIVYLHPYEVDTEEYPDFYMAELANAPFTTRLRMRSFWLRRSSLYQRYDRLLSEFKFVPIQRLIEDSVEK